MDHSSYDNEYNRRFLAQYFKLAQLQKNPKYVQQNWETDIIRNMPWGNYGEFRNEGKASGGAIAKHIVKKKSNPIPSKLSKL